MSEILLISIGGQKVSENSEIYRTYLGGSFTPYTCMAHTLGAAPGGEGGTPLLALYNFIL